MSAMKFVLLVLLLLYLRLLAPPVLTLLALNMKLTVASLLLLGLVAGQDSSVKGRLK